MAVPLVPVGTPLRPDQLPTAIPRLAQGVLCTRTAAGILRLRAYQPPASRLRRALGWLIPVSNPTEVELDDIGTFVVERMDDRSLAALTEDLAGHLQLTRREAEVALGDFLLLLLRRRLAIVVAGEPEPSTTAGGVA